MNIQESRLAQLYATAFLNIYCTSITEDIYNKLIKTRLFLLENPDYLFIYKLPRHFNLVKKQIINKLLEQFDLPAIFYKLTELLLETDRLALLPLVLHHILLGYEERNYLMPTVITSSSSISEKQARIIQDVIKQVSGKKILPKYRIDTKLIAGIRIQSNTLLWEYSVAKQLRIIEKEIHRGD